MANQQHVDILTRDGVRVWNIWRKENPAIRPDLREADLREAHLSKADLRGADLTKADLTETNLTETRLRGADLAEAYLSGADLTKANLRKADLRGARLYEADLTEANLTETNLSTADLACARLYDAHLSEADLSGADLTEADLTNADLSKADLRGANLNDADLREANLTDADLRGANLMGADLTLADLRDADLREANLALTMCVRTIFFGATLTGCNVYGISAWDVYLADAKQADLRITPARQKTNITVDNMEVAQFLYLLLSNQKVRDVLDTITSKVVLILGRFSTERKPVLDAIRDALRSHSNGYIPVLFDFDPQQDKPVLETVKTLANLARFVIADLTDPNMVRSELTYITANLPTVPIAPVIERGADLPTEYGTWRDTVGEVVPRLPSGQDLPFIR